MSEAKQVYEDEWGAIIVRPAYNEIRWYDSTAAMSKSQFQAFLSTFAAKVGENPGRGVLVDTSRFRMDPSNMDADWRDTNIVPKYNAAGVKKFAFLMNDGMPMIGKDPITEGPADYKTAYFGTRRDALDWIGG